MYYIKCQHNIKNINNTKLDKSIVYKYKFWQRQSLFGTSAFSEDIGLAASQSCRQNRCFSVRYTCTEWRNSTRWLSSAVLCLAALLLGTQVVARRWMQYFCTVCLFVVTRSRPESTCLVPAQSECPTSGLSESFDSELFNESSSFTVSEFEVWNTLHHHVIVLALLHFNFHQ